MRPATGLLAILLQIVTGSAADIASAPTADTPEIDPCKNSTEIPSDDRRVSDLSVPDSRCDTNITTGWYRFTIGGTSTTIPTQCLRPQACGSGVSLRIDLDGAGIPVAGEEIKAWTCGAYDVLGKFDCCVLRTPARIKNCTTFLAYHLHSPDRCSVSYCVQDIHDSIPPRLLVKTGEDVNSDSTMTSAAPDNPNTPTTTIMRETPDIFRTVCTEGQVWCKRGPAHTHGCKSLEDCQAVPDTTESETSDVITYSHSEAGLSTSTNTDLTTPSAANDTDSSTNGSAIPDPVTDIPVADHTTPPTSGRELDTTTVPSTAFSIVTRVLFHITTTKTTDNSPTATTTATPIANDTSTSLPHVEGSLSPSDSNTTDRNTSQSVLGSETSSSAGNTTSTTDEPAGIIPQEARTTASPGTANMSESPSDDSSTGAGITDKETPSPVDFDYNSSSSVSSLPPSLTTIISTSSSSVEHRTTSTSTSTSTETMTSPSQSSLGISTPSSTVAMTTHMTSPTSTILDRTSPTDGAVYGWIVLEFRNTKPEIDYSSKVRSSLEVLLNAMYKQGSHLSYQFTSNDIDVMKTESSKVTTAVVLKVTYEESGKTVTIDADDLLQKLGDMETANELNNDDFVDKMGASIVNFYKYRPSTTDNHYSLFYDKLPLFIAIIVMASICLLICLFGVVYLRFYRHQRSWDTHKDMERAKLKENKVTEGLDNPVPDSEILKDEQTVTETSLTVNGSHPPPSIMTDDEKGWIIPIDQAPESLLQLALRTEDTKL